MDEPVSSVLIVGAWAIRGAAGRDKRALLAVIAALAAWRAAVSISDM